MNSDTKRQYILAAILLTVIAYYLWDAGYFGGKTEQGIQPIPAVTTTATAAAAPAVSIPDMSRIEKLLKSNWPEDWEKDPFYYVTADLQEGDGLLFDKATKASTLDLTGISCISNSCSAVINSNILREGDVISGYRLDKIAFQYVILSKGDQSIRLILTQ
ncbi:MAG: general secretion pathway protein GspB [FCB group bacterium]|nr:general secretion pathway protein GspB [FCB group bacterium]